MSYRYGLQYRTTTKLRRAVQWSGVTRPSTALRIVCRSKLQHKSAIIVDDSQPAPSINYAAVLKGWRDKVGPSCPPLILAPMENLADRPFRMALKHTTGGFDEAVQEFIRVPNATNNVASSVRGITAGYNARELRNVPLAAQLMGSSPEILAAAAEYLVVHKQAPRVDLNCGCPANTVTGHGAGSSLLRTPYRVEECVRAMVAAVAGRAAVTVKLRSGFTDASLLTDNLLAAQAAGASFISLHPRTKVQCYEGRANWSHIAMAKHLLRIPVVGNGDVVSAERALQLVRETGCDAIMVGRGAVQDPLIFLRIRHAFTHPDSAPLQHDSEPDVIDSFLRMHSDATSTRHGVETTLSGRLGRIKLIVRYLFTANPRLMEEAQRILRAQSCKQDSLLVRRCKFKSSSLLCVMPSQVTPEELLDSVCAAVHRHWLPGGPSGTTLVSHMRSSQQPVLTTASA